MRRTIRVDIHDGVSVEVTDGAYEPLRLDLREVPVKEAAPAVAAAVSSLFVRLVSELQAQQLAGRDT